jgi:hypothetical protein
MPEGIPFKLDDYLQLVDWTGRLMREDKRGCIANNLPAILERLNIAPEQWLKTSHHFEKQFKHFVGETSQVKSFLKKIERKSCHGITNCQTAFT